MTILILIAIVVIAVMILGGVYNKLVGLREGTRNTWAQVDVQLQQRADLVPNLVQTVKGYADFESETLINVIKARTNGSTKEVTDEMIKNENVITQGISKIFALAESYPDLKANQNFLELQESLQELEVKIAQMRQFYNDSVGNYEGERQKFPTNIVAGMFGFNQIKYFEASAESKVAPKVDFSK
jgi:LemA protein